MTEHIFPPHKILVPTDLTSTSAAALQFARVLHQQFGGAVHLLHVQHFDLPPYFSSGQLQSLKRDLKKSAKIAAEYLRKESSDALGFEAEASVVAGHPVEAILEATGSLAADLIVMGTHGRRGADRFWLGSVAERILHESPKPILAVRDGTAAAPLEHILCPVSFSAVGRETLQYAAAIAEAGKLRMTVIHAVEEKDKQIDCTLVPDDVRKRCRIEELTYHGDAAGAILTAAHEMKPDVIVMGAERRASVFGMLFSGTTERIMQWGEAPLMVVPRSATTNLLIK
ncbi:MAG TPA: universal stress protein [Acidobacteriota bacterium]|nr:universal stress protein [Acidobacteriota bacterium]